MIPICIILLLGAISYFELPFALSLAAGGAAALLVCLQIVLEIRLWNIAFGGEKKKDDKEGSE